jgi:hypothetical protein
MRLNRGEGNGVRLARGTSLNTDRIARSAANIAICRIFLRLVLLWVIDRQGMATDRYDKYRPRIDRLEMSGFAGLSRSRCCLAISPANVPSSTAVISTDRIPTGWESAV